MKKKRNKKQRKQTKKASGASPGDYRKAPEIEQKLGMGRADRRVELLRLIMEAGHPSLLGRRALAHRYGVAPSTITRDIQALCKVVSAEIKPRIDLVVEAVFDRAILAALERYDYDQAVELTVKWLKALQLRGHVQPAPTQFEGNITGAPAVAIDLKDPALARALGDALIAAEEKAEDEAEDGGAEDGDS